MTIDERKVFINEICDKHGFRVEYFDLTEDDLKDLHDVPHVKFSVAHKLNVGNSFLYPVESPMWNTLEKMIVEDIAQYMFFQYWDLDPTLETAKKIIKKAEEVNP